MQAYLSRKTTVAFFKKFNVGLIDPDFNNYVDLLVKTKNVDFETGRDVNVTYGPAGVADVVLALLGYLELTKKYKSWFDDGYYMHGDIPEDLLLPFGKFLDRYGLQGSLGILRNLLWLNDALNTPTWSVMAVVGYPQVSAFFLGVLGPSFKWPATHSSETLFDHVLEHMRDDVLLESTVYSSRRTSRGVTLVVQTPKGRRTVVAKKLLIAATPSPDNIGPWDLSREERSVFSKFSWETLYVGIVGNTSVPVSIPGIRNAPNNASHLFLPQGNFCDAYARGGFDGTKSDYWNARVIGKSNLTSDEARSLMLQPLKKMVKTADPKLYAFASHGLTAPKVSAQELRAGFYKKLYALQGRRSTFWTGLAWAPDYTPILWDFNEKLFPRILQGL